MTATTIRHNIDPYAHIGTDVSTKDTVDEMLEAAGAAFNAELAPLTALTGDGVVEVPSHKAVVRDDTNEPMAVVTNTYNVIQYRDVMDYCLAAVDLRPDDAAVKHVGTMAKGAQFFATVDLGSLFIDPAGANDQVDRYLVAFASHNGSLAIMLAEYNMRVACSNQAPAVRRESQNKLVIKHTKNAADRLAIARSALGIADRAAKEFEEQATKLFQTPSNKDAVIRIANKVWPLKADASDKGKTQHANRLNKLVSIYEGPTGAPSVGENRWAVFNTFTEYLDHGRGTDADKRALATILPDGHIEKSKLTVGAMLLN